MKDDKLNVGSKVECRYRGKSKYYPATITRVHGNDTFDVHYDDGDQEFGVKKEFLHMKSCSMYVHNDLKGAGLPQRMRDFTFGNILDKGTIQKHESFNVVETNMNTELVVGSKVECRYRCKSKYYPAKIKRVHSNNDTFDVLYDDGEEENYVNMNMKEKPLSCRVL